MFGVLNERIAHYFKFPEEGPPLFARTTETSYVQKAIRCHSELWQKSDDFEDWFKRQPLELDINTKREVELECKLLEEIARHRRAETQA